MQNEANFGWSGPGHRGAGRPGSLHAVKKDVKDVKDVNGHPTFPGCQTVGDPIRSNLAAGYADCVRLVEWPDKTGWQKLDGSQRDRVQPGLIRQDPVLVRPSSGERPRPPCVLGCRKAAGPCRSQSRLVGWMVVKRYGMGSKWRRLGERCYAAGYDATPLFLRSCVQLTENERQETDGHISLFFNNLRRKPSFPNFQKNRKT